MASLDESGYSAVTQYGSQQEMVQFIHRAMMANVQNWQAISAEEIGSIARWHIKIPKTFQDLLRELKEAASELGVEELTPSAPELAPSAPILGPDADQAFRAPAAGWSGSSSYGCHGIGASGASSSQHSAEMSLEGLEHLDGPLFITPASWWDRFRSRQFELVLRSQGHARGLLVFASFSRDEVLAVANRMQAQLGPSVQNLAQPPIYDALHTHPNLLQCLASNPAEVAMELGVPTAPSAPSQEVHPEDEHGECPICLERIHPGQAAMRCNGLGGIHHYFHASCLQRWKESCPAGRPATCPTCRGGLQMNGRRLQEFLNGEASSGLTQDDRTYWQHMAEGLQGKNRWEDMNKLEKAAYAGGLLAAAGWGFTLGFTEREHHSTSLLVLNTIPQEHRMAQGIGWIVGLLARILRESLREKQEREARERRNQGGRRN